MQVNDANGSPAVIRDDELGDLEFLHPGKSGRGQNVMIRIFAGDPGAGGTSLAETTVATVDAGESQPFSVTLTGFPFNLNIALYAIVDPQNDIDECNDGNNKAGPTQNIECSSGPV